MSEINEIEEHFKRNKQFYIGLGVGILVGAVATGAYFVLHNNAVANKLMIDSQKLLELNYKSTKNFFTTVVEIDAPGNSGNVVKDLTTGAIYPSQGEAEKILGLSKGLISKQMSGQIPTAKGHTFEKLLDGGAPHALKVAA